MQIPSIPPPILTNPLSPDIVAKAVPNVQAAPPLLQRAIDPSPKSEKFNQTRNSKDRSKDGRGRDADDDKDGKNKDGHSVNISV